MHVVFPSEAALGEQDSFEECGMASKSTYCLRHHGIAQALVYLADLGRRSAADVYLRIRRYIQHDLRKAIVMPLDLLPATFNLVGSAAAWV